MRGITSPWLVRRVRFSVVASVLAGALGAWGQSSRPATAAEAGFNKYAYIVYFTPKDRDPLPGYRERLDRILTDIQGFYRRGMERNGFGPLTFPLQRDAEGRLIVHVVKSTRAYARGDDAPSDDIREQVKRALRERGIDIDKEHIILFQNLLFIDGNEIRSWANYTYGGLGDHVCGTAWITDHPLEDSLNLDKEEPILDAHGRKLPLCDYVVAEMGGIAHEFGHALGLPHDRETPEERKTLGVALMGNGNFEYGRERTPKGGKGAFLSRSEATILSSHPLFKRNTTDIDIPVKCEFDDMACTRRDGQLVFTGQVHSDIRPYALVAYHDSQLESADYDATSWVSDVDADGRFEVHIGELKPGPYELRLRCCCVNGAFGGIEFRYALHASLDLPAASFRRQFLYQRFVEPAREARDSAQVLAGLGKLKDEDDFWYRKAQMVYSLLTRKPQSLRELAAVGADVREVWLSAVQWESASVWGAKPTCDGTPDAVPLESAERVHAHGLYAHANSRYVYRLGGKWKQFETYYALQNWTPGSVVFVIRCDGQERLRSLTLHLWNEEHVALDVAGVDKLELIVEDRGNDEWDDDSNWLSPKLTR
jgi:hypothetical protein